MAIEKEGPFGPDYCGLVQTLLFFKRVRLPSQTGQWGSLVIQLPSATPVGGGATIEGCGSSDGNKAWRYTTGPLGLFLVTDILITLLLIICN